MNLFKKAAIFTDIHFGEHQDSEVHNQDCLDFLEWFRVQTEDAECDTIIFMGDWFHNRVRTENRTAWYSRQGIEILQGIDLPVFWIVGNHELYLKDSRDIHSLQYLSKYRNFHLINSITEIDGAIFSPWLVGDEHQQLLKLRAQYLFGHFELPFFLMNQVIEKAYDGKGLHMDDFQNVNAVYSGHFHKRQVKLNKKKVPIYYIGNCFGHNMNDVNDPDRGMAILEWGETLPEYLSWPDAPTYHRFTMTEFFQRMDDLIADGQRIVGPRSTIEFQNDLDLDAATLNELREAIQARQIRFPPRKSDSLVTDPNVIRKQYKSLDEMIESKLESMNYDSKYNRDLLIQIYREI